MTLVDPGSAPVTHSLDERYRAQEGRVFLSGIQALVRVLVDQHRADADAGRRVGIALSRPLAARRWTLLSASVDADRKTVTLSQRPAPV